MTVQDNQLIDLTLLNLDITSSLIGMTSLSLFIFTSYASKNLIMNSSLRNAQFRPAITLDDIVFVGRLIMISAGFISATTSTIRLILLYQKAMRNEPLDGTLSPNIWLTVGIWTSLAGGMIVLIGDYQRTQQSPRVPIAY